MTILDKNYTAICKKAPAIAEHLRCTVPGTAYSKVQAAKTGELIPVLTSGQALHSLYNPQKEAERFFTAPSDFMLFCGIGAGIHIKTFLNKNPHACCALTEINYPSFKELISLIDYTDILTDSRVTVLPPCTVPEFTAALINTYLPAIHGTFTCHILRPWNIYFEKETKNLPAVIEESLKKITADFSVQSHFGKIWLRNILLNGAIAGAIHPLFPRIDSSRTAFVLGAGPSLETVVPILSKKRTQYTIFCSDTVLPVLTAHNITPDFFIAIDPQHISYLHTMRSFSKNITGIFDLSANTAIVRQFYTNGNPLFFTAGEHPLVQAAAAFSPFPQLSTASGTVAITAYRAAQALGFRQIEYSGMDFAYTNGKAYTRGTYLSHLYSVNASRITTKETAFVNLMFRTETYHKQTLQGITYRTALLDSYREAFEKKHIAPTLWTSADFCTFPYIPFYRLICSNLKQQEISSLTSLLPYFAWCRRKGINNFDALELVSELISGYTVP